ncbi:MAG: hypothetical protein ACYC8T_15130 [Myxococcaceae bacterium]
MLVLLPVLAAAPAPVKLASPGFNYVNIDEKTGSLFAEYFARQLEGEGVTVLLPQEIAAVLGLERQKQLLGCADENGASCLAELAGGLGANGIITGTIGKVGTGFTVSMKVVTRATPPPSAPTPPAPPTRTRCSSGRAPPPVSWRGSWLHRRRR